MFWEKLKKIRADYERLRGPRKPFIVRFAGYPAELGMWTAGAGAVLAVLVLVGHVFGLNTSPKQTAELVVSAVILVIIGGAICFAFTWLSRRIERWLTKRAS